MTFSGNVRNETKNSGLDFGGDLSRRNGDGRWGVGGWGVVLSCLGGGLHSALFKFFSILFFVFHWHRTATLFKIQLGSLTVLQADTVPPANEVVELLQHPNPDGMVQPLLGRRRLHNFSRENDNKDDYTGLGERSQRSFLIYLNNKHYENKRQTLSWSNLIGIIPKNLITCSWSNSLKHYLLSGDKKADWRDSNKNVCCCTLR